MASFLKVLAIVIGSVIALGMILIFATLAICILC